MDNFHVLTFFYDSAQVVELIVIYVLDMLGRIVNLEQVGFYHDDGIIFNLHCNCSKTFKIQKKDY